METRKFLSLMGLVPFPMFLGSHDPDSPDSPLVSERSVHMPLSSVGSYLPAAQEFLNHWAQVNLALGGAPATDLKLQGAYTLANLTSDRAALQAAITATEGSDNVRQTAATNRDLKKGAILPRIGQFRAGARFKLVGTGYVGALPRVPSFKGNQSLFLKPFDDMANLWLTINADTSVPGFTPPLLLPGGYTQANHATELAALRAAYIAVDNANETARLNRKKRDVLLPPIKKRLLQYRVAVLATFGPNDPLTLSVPLVTPPPGSTPQPVNLSGVWNATTSKADLDWSASTNANLAHYSVRTAPVPYHAADESVVGEVSAGALEFSTVAGLLAPGSVAQFKVYVVLTTGNEKGSNTVSVTHPGP